MTLTIVAIHAEIQKNLKKLLNKLSRFRGYGFMCDGDYYKHCQQYDFHTGRKSILI